MFAVIVSVVLVSTLVGFTALMHAALGGSDAVAGMLLDNGADVNAADNYGMKQGHFLVSCQYKYGSVHRTVKIREQIASLPRWNI